MVTVVRFVGPRNDDGTVPEDGEAVGCVLSIVVVEQVELEAVGMSGVGREDLEERARTGPANCPKGEDAMSQVVDNEDGPGWRNGRLKGLKRPTGSGGLSATLEIVRAWRNGIRTGLKRKLECSLGNRRRRTAQIRGTL
jgi:hypothetical protein